MLVRRAKKSNLKGTSWQTHLQPCLILVRLIVSGKSLPYTQYWPCLIREQLLYTPIRKTPTYLLTHSQPSTCKVYILEWTDPKTIQIIYMMPQYVPYVWFCCSASLLHVNNFLLAKSISLNDLILKQSTDYISSNGPILKQSTDCISLNGLNLKLSTDYHPTICALNQVLLFCLCVNNEMH